MPKVYDSETKERAQPFVLLDANGDQITTFTSSLSSASTSSLSNVVASASSTAILASNASRKGATLVNDSTATLYLKYGATASTTSSPSAPGPKSMRTAERRCDPLGGAKVRK